MRRLVLFAGISKALGMSAKATIGNYPGTSNGVTGLIRVDEGLRISGTVVGLEKSIQAGIHIHEGFSCDDAGDHYFKKTDPWTTTYATSADGIAAIDFEISGFTMTEVAGRTIVLHASDGARIGCGVLEPTSGLFVSFSTLGMLLVTETGDSITIQGTLAVNATVEIHEGFQCDNPGPVYVPLTLFRGSPVAYRAVVLANDNESYACGILGATLPPLTTTVIIVEKKKRTRPGTTIAFTILIAIAMCVLGNGIGLIIATSRSSPPKDVTPTVSTDRTPTSEATMV